ncbi:MAG TPA: exodeoxyribonuclease VII large subunit, partial [Chloroflexota bacterium]
ADLRAPTPTAAAELATQITAAQLHEDLRSLELLLTNSMMDILTERRDALQSAGTQLGFFSPLRRIESDRQRVDEMARRAQAAAGHYVRLETSALDGLQKRLEALNPVQILKRGYAVVRRRKDGVVVHRVSQARGGLSVRVSDGEFDVEVTESHDA